LVIFEDIFRLPELSLKFFDFPQIIIGEIFEHWRKRLRNEKKMLGKYEASSQNFRKRSATIINGKSMLQKL